MAKAFASSADLGEKQETLEVLADGVYAVLLSVDEGRGGTDSDALNARLILANHIGDRRVLHAAATPTAEG